MALSCYFSLADGTFSKKIKKDQKIKKKYKKTSIPTAIGILNRILK